MRAKLGAALIAGLLVIFAAEGRSWAYCRANYRLVEVGRIPDVILPAGRPTCVVIPPAFLAIKATPETSVGNCGMCPHVRNGYPHIAVRDGVPLKPCIPANFGVIPPNGELTGQTTDEQVRFGGTGFVIYSDGTPGSGTIEIMSKGDNEMQNSTCDPALGPGPYVIGTFNYFVTSGVTDTAFTHVVSAANKPVPSHTVLTHPLLDGQGGARPILASVWNHGTNPGIDNNHPTALSYGIDVASKWSIVNLGGGAFELGAQFNVEIAPPSDSEAFVAPPVPAYRRSIAIPSIMDHDPQALLFPAGGGSLPNGTSSVGSYFNSVSRSWSLWNMNGVQIPDGANFFVRFIGAPSPYSFAQQVQSSPNNTFVESLFLDNSFGLTEFSRLFVSPIYAPGPNQPFTPDGPTVYAPLGLWWTGGQWAIWRQDWQAIPQNAAFNVYWHRPAIVAYPTLGDSNGDKHADITLVGGNLSTMPIATSSGDGYTFDSRTSGWDPSFYLWAQVAKPISGDFDGDGRSDVALTGVPGWSTIPIAFSQGDGSFRVTNGGVSNDLLNKPLVLNAPTQFADTNFPFYAGQAGANPVGGDFNGDGLQDIALLAVPGEEVLIPVVFSRADGTFYGLKRGVEMGDTSFTSYAAQGAKAVIGDFDGDGRSDIALTGVPGWTTIPVAFSNGNGAFHATNLPLADFPARAAEPGARALAGDFNGDEKADIAIVGGTTSGDVMIAFSNGNGTFHVSSSGWTAFGGIWCWLPSFKMFAGDFNGDGKADIGCVGSFVDGTDTWYYRAVGLSNGDATFSTAWDSGQQPLDFFTLAATNGAAVLSGSPASPYVRNLARGMSTSQSPTAFGGDPGRAVDGNPDGNWPGNSVTHTQPLSQPWWQVDLGAPKSVSSIDIFNRTDCCADRLTNFNVMTSTDASTWSTTNVAGQGGRPTSIAVNAQARYVMVQLVGTNALSLAEVYVWGP